MSDVDAKVCPVKDLLLQATVCDPASAEHQHDMSMDVKRLLALTSTLQKGQKIWLELYSQVFKNVRCLSQESLALCCYNSKTAVSFTLPFLW